jgi:DNA-binding transcriptional LysR family regulator
MDRLQAMSAFVAVVDARGFAPAARRLKLSPSAITRLVASLEEHLGIRLLHRTTRSVTVTDAGMRFLERARSILADCEEAESSAREERAKPVGKLVVTAPMVFGRLHIGPLLSAYLRKHRDVVAELRLTDRYVNLIDDGVDLAVRIGALEDSNLVVRRVGETRRVLVASPKYLAGHPRLSKPDQLGRHATIGLEPFGAGPDWKVYEHGRETRVRVAHRYLTNSADDAIWQALHGGGITMALSYQVHDHVSAGRLTTVLPKYEPEPLPIQLVYPTSRLLSSKVRALIELVVSTCEWNF